MRLSVDFIKQSFENLNDADITSMPMSTTYRAKVEHSIVFAKIVNQYFQRQQFFFGGATTVVFTAVLNQGRESFTSQSERIFCSRWG